ncbi:MAG: MmgE/PrpD family protein, partial [Rhodobacterales bacterium]|nr:MmgE/PrpD family protein [Rhodobacterales bacterium]
MTGSVPVHATERLARRALSVRAGDLDAETRAVARHVVVDALACAAAGRRTEAARVVRDTAAGLFGGGDSPVWYQGLRLSPAGAAYANAAATAALDLDDGNRAAGGHPGPAIVPAVLAEAQAIDAPGTAVLAALVAGYDVAVRMGRGEIHRAYASGNWTGFGVVAALAHLRGLDAATLAHALAIHAYHGPHVTDLTDSVEMGAHVKEVIPWSVAAAFGSVALAQNGYTGARDAIDVGRRTDPAPTLRDLDGRHLILDTYFKRYSVCRWAHAAIDGLLGLMATHGFTGDAIRGLKVETFQRAILLHNSPRPPSLEAA